MFSKVRQKAKLKSQQTRNKTYSTSEKLETLAINRTIDNFKRSIQISRDWYNFKWSTVCLCPLKLLYCDCFLTCISVTIKLIVLLQFIFDIIYHYISYALTKPIPFFPKIYSCLEIKFYSLQHISSQHHSNTSHINLHI